MQVCMLLFGGGASRIEENLFRMICLNVAYENQNELVYIHLFKIILFKMELDS